MDSDVIPSPGIRIDLSDFIILRKIPIGFPSDPMRSDYRIDRPGSLYSLFLNLLFL
jgi:hypothetical protein